MADTRNEWRAERGGEGADGPEGPVAGWLDDRGVSEVIGSILVFGLLVSLLAIVQTQAVPDANQEVEAKHSADVQGDMANLQAAISRTGQFGGTESTTVTTGMSYPSRLVLYNPPAVQGTLSTSEEDSVQLAGFSAPEAETAEYLTTDPVFESTTVSYRVDYNRYDNAPTTRYEHGAIVDEYEEGDEFIVESQDTLVSGRYISLTLLGDGLQASQVRPASVTTYPVSAPSQSTTVSTGSNPARIVVPTDLPAEVWVTELLAGEIDENALQGSTITDCDSLNQGGSDATTNPADDGNYVVDCDYDVNTNGPNTMELFFEKQETYDLRMSKVAFTSVDEPPPFYVTDVSPENTNDLVVEVRDRYNNPVDRQVELTLVKTNEDGDVKSKDSVETGPNGQYRVDSVVNDAYLYVDEGPNAAGSTPSVGTTPTCPDLSCAIVSPTLSASSLITATGVTADASTDTVSLDLENDGERDVQISEVQLGYATQRTEQPLTVTLGGVTTCVTGSTGTCTSTTLVRDGPDQINSIEVDGTTYDGPTPATENKAPVAFTDSSDERPVLEEQTSETLVLSLVDSDSSDAFTLSGEDSIDISVTVYYEDGSVATYSRTLFDEGGGGT